MPFSLFDDLKVSGFHSSVLTTFSVDPAFYDASVQYRLRAMGCQNNILMADRAMLTQALGQMPEAFINAGRKYLIVPMSGSGCFHSKIALRYGKSKSKLNIGSANVTSAGWGSNQEILSSLNWSKTSDTHDNNVQLGLIAKTHDWLMSRMLEINDPNLRYKLDLLASQSTWLKDAPRPVGKQAFTDGTEIDLLLSDATAPSGLANQFIAVIEGKVERLVVISPYWDTDLSALSRLSAAFGDPPIHVFMSMAGDVETRQSTFPIQASDQNQTPAFHPVDDENTNRFLHAKLIMAQTESHDYLIYGSANCTVAALGIRQAPGVNAEAVIYRRLPRGTIDAQLGLEYGATILSSDIISPKIKDEESTKLAQFDPGKIERRDNQLFWSCPDGISANGSCFRIGDERLQTQFAKGRRPSVLVSDELTEATIIVRIELADGRVSRPVIVSDPEMLMAAAPNPLANNIRRKLESVLNGDNDLINLVRDIHLIFDDEIETSRANATHSGQNRSASTSTAEGCDYATPEEFRQALNLRSDIYSGSFAHSDNPALQMILKIVLRGIVELESSETIDQAEAKSAEELTIGEDQDDEGYTDGLPTATSNDLIFGSDSHLSIPTDDFNRNRTALLKAIGKFEAHIRTLRESKTSIDLNFVTRALFMIYLMLYGCTRKYALDEGGEDVLIPFSGIGTDQQQDGFLVQAARIVNGIWGPWFVNSLMGRIPLDKEHTNLPLPILTLVVLSRWILAAILSEARIEQKAERLRAILERQVPELFAATSAFSDVDTSQVATVIRHMEQNVGMEEFQSVAIHAVLSELERRLTLGSQ